MVGTRPQNQRFSAAFAGFCGGIRWGLLGNRGGAAAFWWIRDEKRDKMRPLIRRWVLRSALGVHWMRPLIRHRASGSALVVTPSTSLVGL
jgi:hypothetical protein